VLGLTALLGGACAAQAQPYLRDFDANCVAASRSRSPACLTAIRRFCEATARGGGGVQQQVLVNENIVGVACFPVRTSEVVPYREIRTDNPACRQTLFAFGTEGPSAHCTSAARRWCQRTGKGDAGLLQGRRDLLSTYVACFTPASYQDVPLAELQANHGGCNALDRSETGDCLSALQKWCVDRGRGNAGVAQEIGAGVFGVACLAGASYVQVRPVPVTAGPPPCIGRPGSPCPGGTTPPPPPSGPGQLAVTLGYAGAPPPQPSTCRGVGRDGSVTATGPGPSVTLPYQFPESGTAASAPFCRVLVTFPALAPGEWTVRTANGVQCSARVESQRITGLDIQVDTRQCRF
jgi:hypothetical protein